ncbi:hypothetical protein B0H11DRAFT_1976312 [Mycena galericulata]|nr:hypothetical protein B0H11DRAFT_1976312 [Mycena galericulata]
MDAMILALGQASTSSAFESQAKSLIAASEANIARIESQIRDLVRLRDRERGIVARLRAAIAPIHKLPAELLAEIFLLATEQISLSRKQAIKKVQVLTRVCAYWRQVAHTTPRLWTTSIFIQHVQKTPTDAYLACVKAWLGRSAPLPIPVNLQSSGKADIGPLMDILGTAADRWSSALFVLSSLSALRHVPRNSVNCLASLHLESADSGEPSRIMTFSFAPCLRTVTLAMRRPNLLPMPWSQLTRIDIRSKSPRACLDILLQCTNIVVAKFDTTPWQDLPDLSNVEMAALPSLKSLELDFSDMLSTGAHFMPFLERLALPALNTLILELDVLTPITWTSTSFTEFQRRSPNMVSLSIQSSNIGSEELLTALLHAPDLVELYTDNCYACFDDSVIAALHYAEGAAVHLAPKLESLALLSIDTDFDQNAMDAMIQSRWWTDEELLALPSPPKIARWSSIDICGETGDGEYISAELEDKLVDYRSQGLEVYVR